MSPHTALCMQATVLRGACDIWRARFSYSVPGLVALGETIDLLSAWTEWLKCRPNPKLVSRLDLRALSVQECVPFPIQSPANERVRGEVPETRSARPAAPQEEEQDQNQAAWLFSLPPSLM